MYKRIALTIDDLPFVSAHNPDEEIEINSLLLQHLQQNNVKATGFVVGSIVDKGKTIADQRLEALKKWELDGHLLANHTYSHLPLSKISLNDFESDVIKNEKILASFWQNNPKYFRFPYLDHGNTIEKTNRAKEFLYKRSYIIVPVSIDAKDFFFNKLYDNGYENVVEEYLKYTKEVIYFLEQQAFQFYGRLLSQIMLVHANRINACCLGKVIVTLKQQGYEFVSLHEVLNEPVYQQGSAKMNTEKYRSWQIQTNDGNTVQITYPSVDSIIVEAYNNCLAKKNDLIFHEKEITCILPIDTMEDMARTVKELRSCNRVGNIFIVNSSTHAITFPDGCQSLPAGFLQQTQTWKTLVSHIDTPYTLLYLQNAPLQLGAFAIERMLQVISDTDAGMLYTDRYKMKNGSLHPYPVNDYQEGSLRDDFDFGSLLFYRSSVLIDAVNEMNVHYQTAALYDLRLKVSKRKSLFHLPEFLYTELEKNFRKSEEDVFDFSPKNHLLQDEMEQVCTQYLKDVGAWLKPIFTQVEFIDNAFPVEATVVIPVYNREKTIEDAVRSALIQETSFPINLIVVDNHSTDNTTKILREFASGDNRLIHLILEKDDLNIGGAWNHAIMHPKCGKFAIQLDSDDLYIHKNVVQTIVDAFYEQHCAMIVGTYQLVNFHLQEISSGIIDHKEWTSDNGRNNALRMHGFGAPRAFYTPILRQIKFPNTNYGEDYAVGLAISRNYPIGRIYHPLYLCRRWDDNTDALLDVHKRNMYNKYKDYIRTIELQARKNRTDIQTKISYQIHETE